MPKVSKDSASQVEQMGPMGEDRHEDLSGYTVDFMSFTQSGDLAPLLKGLEGDACQCPHWGYVLKGSITMRVGDREEIYGPGDAFYVPPGHSPSFEAGTEMVQFSPSEELAITVAALKRNMEAMQAGG
jgi:Cupin domain